MPSTFPVEGSYRVVFTGKVQPLFCEKPTQTRLDKNAGHPC